MPLGEHTPFHAAFAAGSRDWDRFLPHPTGRIAHRSIHAQPVPVDPAQLIKLLDSYLPELEKHACFYPRLKPIVRRRMRTELGLVEGLPLATRSQHVEDGVGTAAIGNTGASPAKAMRVDLGGKEGLQSRPQFMRSLKS